MIAIRMMMVLWCGLACVRAEDRVCEIEWKPERAEETAFSYLLVDMTERGIRQIRAGLRTSKADESWTVTYVKGAVSSAEFLATELQGTGQEKPAVIQQISWKATNGEFPGELKELQGIMALVREYDSQGRLKPAIDLSTAEQLFETIVNFDDPELTEQSASWTKLYRFNATHRYWTCTKVGFCCGALLSVKIRESDGAYQIQAADKFVMSPRLRANIRKILKGVAL